MPAILAGDLRLLADFREFAESDEGRIDAKNRAEFARRIGDQT